MSTPSEKTGRNTTVAGSKFFELALEHVKAAGREKELEAFMHESPEERKRRKIALINAETGDLDQSVYFCPLCKNKGYTAILKGLDIVLQSCKCMAKRRTIIRMKKSGLESVIQNYRFDNFKTDKPYQQELVRITKRFLQEKGHGLLSSGQSGCGKTHLCTAISGHLIKQGHELIYLPYRDEIMRIKQAANDAEVYQARMQELKEVDTLYIDDLFKGTPTQADINAMYELIGYRYNNREALITLVSTELSVGELRAVDEAIAGRIVEICGGQRNGYIVQIAQDANKNHRMQ